MKFPSREWCERRSRDADDPEVVAALADFGPVVAGV